jgi:hypothetical protein
MILFLAAAAHAETTQLSEWQLTAQSKDRFEATNDTGVRFREKPTARLQTSASYADLGSLTLSVDAGQYQGKRIRFSSNAKVSGVEGRTGLWIRISNHSTPLRSYADTHDVELKGSSDWTALAIVIDVPEDARTVELGLSQEGRGTSWFGPVSVETVDDSVPVTYNAGARNFGTAPLLCSKAAPTGSHIRKLVCYDFRTGRIRYTTISDYFRSVALSGTKVGTPRGWLWVWG